MPLATEKLSRRSSKEAIQEATSSCIETLMHEYERDGTIGRSRPESKEEARKQAAAICYGDARRHAGEAKVPRA